MIEMNRITAVVACTDSGVIGLDGGMPWKLSSDLQRFKSITMGGTLIMGRKTFESIGKPLPGRQTIVLSRSKSPVSDDAKLHWACDRPKALAEAERLGRPTFVVGGAEIYRMLFDSCTDIHITRVLSLVSGDTRIQIPLQNFELIELSRYPQTAKDSVPTEFQRWRRKNSVPKF